MRIGERHLIGVDRSIMPGTENVPYLVGIDCRDRGAA